MVATVAAYLTGTVDGKEAFDALSQAGQAELKEHKLLGTYLVLASAVLVVFKLLSAMIQRGLMKATYLLVLIVFTAGILKQGKDGGELVYKYGANVERVADLDSELFDVQEELDELKEETKSITEKVEEKAAEIKAVTKEVTAKAEEKASEVKESVSDAAEAVAEKASEVVESAKEDASHAMESVKKSIPPAADTVEEKAVETAKEAVPAVPEMETVPHNISQPEVATH